MSIFNPEIYWSVMSAMILIALIVFFALQRIEAPYGISFSAKWGPSIGNRLGWILMEAPAFITMVLIWATSSRSSETAPCVMAGLFLLHYFQRTFIFPLLMRGRSRMSLMIPVMGMVFNVINVYLIGGWLFHLSPSGLYSVDWLLSPEFIAGTLIFFAGMTVNIHSDHVIRTLRKPGDTRHYIPRKGMYRYVAGANYFGEVTEWIGFAVLTWSSAGAVFALWTFANLAPRARTLHRRYTEEFSDEFRSLNLRYIIPYIY